MSITKVVIGSPTTLIYADLRYRAGKLVNESALLDEWLSIRYPGVGLNARLRLGPTSASAPGVNLDPALAAMLQVLNWYADAIVISPGESLVIEAKVSAQPSAVGQVLFYQRLIAQTAALQSYLGTVFQAVVLFAEDDRAVSDFARSLGVRVEIYTPPWIASYISGVQFKPG